MLIFLELIKNRQEIKFICEPKLPNSQNQYQKIWWETDHIMKEILCVMIVFVGMLMSVDAAVCAGKECEFKTPDLDPQVSYTATEIARKIDAEIRRSYWYYLQDSQLLYAAQLDTPLKKIFFFFHQSIIGTFLTIVSYQKSTSICHLSTLVKVGPGNKNPVKTGTNQELTKIFFKTKIGQVVQLSGEAEGINIQANIIDISIQQKEQEKICEEKQISFLKKTYWYYLRNADVIDKDIIKTNMRQYHVYTLINIVGTFLAITTCDEESVQVHTLVRLGKGGITQWSA